MARKGLPKMIGTSLSASKSNTIKSVGKINLSTLTKTSSTFISILQALPTYALSVFLTHRAPSRRCIPRTKGCGALVKIKIDGGLCLHGDKVCLPNGMGGLGFKDIRLFNIALLSRQSSIATTANALKKGFGWQNVNKECHRCGAGTKNLIHAFKDCPTTLAILTCGGLDGRLINNNYEHCIKWIEESWEKPLRGTVKFNFDAAMSNTKTGYGIIVRDFEGFIIGGSFSFKKEEMVTDWVKIYAFEEILN
ncbi:hypothetical protein Goarm_011182 [Gossypium armourianum]|uniref:Uncharacterized protein n=1 Tax=Gossypium armourianum TaxID=34283 RepID=A0A7J9IW22_9ROSI|nr:hypothetical protein [Gossypium armourianum]